MKAATFCLAVCGASATLGAGLSIWHSPGAIRFCSGAICYLRNRISQLPRPVEAVVTLGRLIVYLKRNLTAAASAADKNAAALVIGFFERRLPESEKRRRVFDALIKLQMLPYSALMTRILDDGALLEVINRLSSAKDVGRLVCVSRQLRDGIRRCLPASKWPVVAGGKICEPRSFHAVALHKDGFDGIVTAIKRAPFGGSVLIEPGEYVMPSQLGCFGGGAAHIFGRSKAIIRAENPEWAGAVMTFNTRLGSYHQLIFAKVNEATGFLHSYASMRYRLD